MTAPTAPRGRLFYDIGELGWTMYLAAHMRYLHDRGEPASIAVPDARRVFYRGYAKRLLPIPEGWYRLFGGYPQDGTHLYDPATRRRIKDQSLLAGPIIEQYPDYEVVMRYGKFKGEAIFGPYQHSPGMEELAAELFQDRQIILVFPRCRSGKFGGRNLSRRTWERMVASICREFPALLVVGMGSGNGAYAGLHQGHPGYRDLVGYNDDVTLDLMVALCNTRRAVAAVGSQSGTVKITLLSGVPSFIIGHEEERHTVTENWAGTPAGFYRAGSIFGPRLPFDEKANVGAYRIWRMKRLERSMLAFLHQHCSSP